MDLAFEVVAQGQQASSVAFDTLGPSPRLVVGADASGRADLERLVGGSLRGDLLLGAFQGAQRTGGFSVNVERVRLEGRRVIVVARFNRPPADAIVTQVLTAPFAVASISRADLPNGSLRFVLQDQSGATVSEVEVVAR